MRKFCAIICCVIMCFSLISCGKQENIEYVHVDEIDLDAELEVSQNKIQEVSENSEEVIVLEDVWEEPIDIIEFNSEENLKSEEITTQESNGYVVVIDPGHQGKGNSDKEPVGPGSETMKAKVAAGTTGRTTGVPEYEITLEVSLKLKERLEELGYTVYMTRETHDVDISNSERAILANDYNADAFIRIHVNGSEDTSVSGILTMCQTTNNSYNGSLYPDSRRLSECILDGVVNSTGGKKRSIIETDSMTGINWAMVPSTILEMGFFSNPEEELLLLTEEYQNKIVEGIAEGLDSYFAQE